jgi:hypothetical protein
VKTTKSEKLYFTISCSPEGTTPQQQQEAIRQLWQHTIIMFSVIALTGHLSQPSQCEIVPNAVYSVRKISTLAT